MTIYNEIETQSTTSSTTDLASTQFKKNLRGFLRSLETISFYCSEKNDTIAITCSVYDSEGSPVQSATFAADDNFHNKKNPSSAFSHFFGNFFDALTEDQKNTLGNLFKTNEENMHFELLLEMGHIAYENFYKIGETHLPFKNLQLISQTDEKIGFSFQFENGNSVRDFEIYIFEMGKVRIYPKLDEPFDSYETFFRPLEKKLAAQFPGIYFKRCSSETSETYNEFFYKKILKEYLFSKTYLLKSKFNPSLRLGQKYVDLMNSTRL